MNEAQSAEGEGAASASTGYMRLPAPLVAVALVLFLGLLLAAGLYANANLRGQGVVVPTAAPTPQVSSAPLATPVPATVPATPTRALVVSATATDVGTATAGVVPTSAATALVVAPEATATPQATDALTAVPTVEPTLAAEVGRAYENFWRVRSQALLELDSTYLPDVMSGQYLADTQNLIDELRSENRAIKTQVSLNYSVVIVSDQYASIIDNFVDNSVYVRIGTEEAITTPANDQLSVLYRLEKTSEIWKVVQSVRSP